MAPLFRLCLLRWEHCNALPRRIGLAGLEPDAGSNTYTVPFGDRVQRWVSYKGLALAAVDMVRSTRVPSSLKGKMRTIFGVVPNLGTDYDQWNSRFFQHVGFFQRIWDFPLVLTWNRADLGKFFIDQLPKNTLISPKIVYQKFLHGRIVPCFQHMLKWRRGCDTFFL